MWSGRLHWKQWQLGTARSEDTILVNFSFASIFFQIASDCFPNMFSSGCLELLDGFGMFGMFGFKDWNLAAAKSRGALEHKGCNATVL